MTGAHECFFHRQRLRLQRQRRGLRAKRGKWGLEPQVISLLVHGVAELNCTPVGR